MGGEDELVRCRLRASMPTIASQHQCRNELGAGTRFGSHKNHRSVIWICTKYHGEQRNELQGYGLGAMFPYRVTETSVTVLFRPNMKRAREKEKEDWSRSMMDGFDD